MWLCVCLGLDYFASVFNPGGEGTLFTVWSLTLNCGCSEVSSECQISRSLLSGLSASSGYTSPAPLLVSLLSSQFCSSCFKLGLRESYPQPVQSIYKPKILRKFPYNLLTSIPSGFFSLAPWSTNSSPFSSPKLQFLPPQFKITTVLQFSFASPFQGWKGCLAESQDQCSTYLIYFHSLKDQSPAISVDTCLETIASYFVQCL